MRAVLSILLLLALAGAGPLLAADGPDPRDQVRILEDGPPSAWPEAVRNLIDRHGRIPSLAVASVARRCSSLEDPELLLLVAKGLERRTSDPRAVELLGRLATHPRSDINKAARTTLLRSDAADTVLPALLKLRIVADDPKGEIERRIDKLVQLQLTGKEIPAPQPPPARPLWLTLLRVLALLIAGLLGALLYLWSVRLLKLRRQFLTLPVTPVGNAPMGLVALEGELQPVDETILEHPVTGELCLYYLGADRIDPERRLYLVDASGRVLVDPRGAVLLSSDGVLSPGEKVRMIGTLVPDPQNGRRPVLGKPHDRRHHLERFYNALVQGFLGRFFRDPGSKALFSDPTRCFWIWDDLDRKPFGSTNAVGGMFAVFFIAGCWIMLLTLAGLYLLG